MPPVANLPNAESLRCFLAAAELLNFGRAARRVALTPSAFGQRIRALEDQLGARLFDRTTRSVALTPEGEALLPAARGAVRQLHACTQAVHLEADPPVRLTVGTRFELGLSWLVPALVDVETRRPSWRVETYFGSGPEIIAQLAAGMVDAVVTSAPVARATWATEILHPETYVFCAAPSLIEQVPFAGAADAKGHVLLDVDASLPLARYLLSAAPPMTFAEVRACGTHGAVQQLAVAGRGVAALPEYSAEPDLEAGRLVRLLPHVSPLSDSFRLIWRAGAPLESQLRELAGMLRDQPLR